MAQSEQEIFIEALSFPAGTERNAFLDRVCERDSPLRQRIDELLRLHASEDSVLDRQPLEIVGSLSLLGASAGDEHSEEEFANEVDVTFEALKPHLLEPSREDALGRLGHYDLLEVLGQGGYGIVFKAFDAKLDRLVAIKVLLPHLAATSPPRRRFLREARAAAAVHHENVVQIYAVEESPLPYLVMEFVSGETLQQRSDRIGPFEPEEVIRLGLQIVRGLGAAHEKGLIHRDIKPGNILIEDCIDGRAKLGDFGLARTVDDASNSFSGAVLGTPMYMSPEQVLGEELDQRSDLFSLGSLLYLMVAGRPPFRAPSTLAVLKRVAEDRPRSIRDIIPEVPTGLCDVIAMLHEKSRDDRYGSAREVATTLETCLTNPTQRRPRRRASDRFPGRLLRHPAFVVLAVLLLGFLVCEATGLTAFVRARSSDASHVAGSAPPTGGPRDALAEAGGTVPLEAGNETLDASQEATAASGESTPVAIPGRTSSNIVVTSTLDDGRVGTLRWAVQQGNLHHGEDSITFSPDVFKQPQTITLTAGPLVLADSALTTIQGAAAGVTISGDQKFQVFVIGASSDREGAAQAAIANLTIAEGRVTEELRIGGGILVRNGSTLTMTGCLLRDNEAMLEGGGGGAAFINGGKLVMSNCTLTRNRACEGGAIKNYTGTARVTNCTFVDNSANIGGGFYTLGYNIARTEINNCLFVISPGNDSVFFDGFEVTGDFNLTSDGSAPGSHTQSSADVRLGPLGQYGGATETFPLLTGSSALDAGSNDLVPTETRTDQRGLDRIVNDAVDIGAFEVQ
ncbi:protein kinase [bacterium]|nr:protein kinase [bacterium]